MNESKNIVENMQLYDLITPYNKLSKLEILYNYKIDSEYQSTFFIFIKDAKDTPQ